MTTTNALGLTALVATQQHPTNVVAETVSQIWRPNAAQLPRLGVPIVTSV